jgi:hypothetical protein
MIRELLWPDDRIAHIGRHGIEAHEFERSASGDPWFFVPARRAPIPRITVWFKRMQAGTCCASSSSFLTDGVILLPPAK